MGKRHVTYLAWTIVVLAVSVSAFAADGTLRGRLIDPDGLPLPGVVVTLTEPSGRVRTAVTDGTGAYAFTAPAGHYQLKTELAGFDAATRAVDLTAGTLTLDITLRLASHHEEVTVKGDEATPVVGQPHPDAPVTVTREVVDSGMLPNSQYDDVLPLLPNIVRGPDGLISVAGARPLQGALFVNGFNETDPVSGEPGFILPIEAVDSLDVFSGGYSAELGRATGGVTSAHTRAGANQFHSSLNSFFPRLRFRDGHVEGVDFWEPNAGTSGPIVKGCLFYEEAISYRFDRNPFETLVGTQDQKFNALATWTQLDFQVSAGQHVYTSFSFNPQHTDRANLTAFTPAGTVPALDRRAFTAALGDRLTIGEAATLELRANLIRTRLTLTPEASDLYQVGHDLTHGSYFDRQDLRGARVETSALYAWTAPRGHFVKLGASVGRAALNGSDSAAPVELLRSDGPVSQSIQFLPGERLQASAYETGAFVQDTWTVSPALTIDAGTRYDRTTAIGQTISPRVAWTVKLPGGASTIGGSVGMFGDKLPLEARVFPLLQPRVIQVFDAAGAPLGPARLFTNAIEGPLKAPIATRWDVEFDRHLGSSWLARIKYQERRGRDEPIVNPIPLSDSSGLLALESAGTSRSRSLETTIAYHGPHAGNEIYVSYVRARSQGDLNSFDLIEGTAREPFVQPDAIGPLPADVPNRLLAWGVVRLPMEITLAPFVEIRNGFPYSVIAEDWTYVGPRNGFRYPWFGSLDLYVNKVFRLGQHLPAARIGLKVYSLVSAHTERDVQRDIVRADFGSLYNPIPRFYGTVFELLWGHK
jgi:hypothetical protein